jgi:hypothetical protein
VVRWGSFFTMAGVSSEAGQNGIDQPDSLTFSAFLVTRSGEHCRFRSQSVFAHDRSVKLLDFGLAKLPEVRRVRP